MRPAPPKFTPRAKFIGSLYLACPYCGRISRHQMEPETWRIRCKGKACKRWLLVGILLHTVEGMTGAPLLPPEDMTLEALPVARLQRWDKRRSRAHELVTE